MQVIEKDYKKIYILVIHLELVCLVYVIAIVHNLFILKYQSIYS